MTLVGCRPNLLRQINTDVVLEKDWKKLCIEVMNSVTLRRKGIPEVLVGSVMSLYEGARTRVRLDSELSEEFEVNVWIN